VTIIIQPSIERTAVALECVVMELFAGPLSCLFSGDAGASISISVSAIVAKVAVRIQLTL